MIEINFTINVDCRPAPRPRSRPAPSPRTANDPKPSDYKHYNPTWYNNLKSMIGYKANRIMGTQRPIESPVAVYLNVYRELPPYSKQFGDVDNLLKTILDSLNGICYCDDRQVIFSQIALYRGDPKIEVKIKSYESNK